MTKRLGISAVSVSWRHSSQLAVTSQYRNRLVINLIINIDLISEPADCQEHRVCVCGRADLASLLYVITDRFGGVEKTQK